jgi:hypothetical protein
MCKVTLKTYVHGIWLHLINIRLWIKLKIEYHGYQSKIGIIYSGWIWALMKQLSIAQCYATITYRITSYDKEEYLAYHKSLISSLNTLLNKEHDDFSSLYWITKFHKNPYSEKNTTNASLFWTK